MQNAFVRLVKKGIASEVMRVADTAHMAHRIANEGWRGGVFITLLDLVDAVFSGNLYVQLCDPSLDASVTYDVMAELGKGHMHPFFISHDCLCAQIGSRDIDWCNTLLDQQQQEEHRVLADHHRLRRLLCCMNKQCQQRREARTIIGNALVEWSLQPGGTLYKRHKRDFEECVKT